jgi:hypothetical protein
MGSISPSIRSSTTLEQAGDAEGATVEEANARIEAPAAHTPSAALSRNRGIISAVL